MVAKYGGRYPLCAAPAMKCFTPRAPPRLAARKRRGNAGRGGGRGAGGDGAKLSERARLAEMIEKELGDRRKETTAISTRVAKCSIVHITKKRVSVGNAGTHKEVLVPSCGDLGGSSSICGLYMSQRRG